MRQVSSFPTRSHHMSWRVFRAPITIYASLSSVRELASTTFEGLGSVLLKELLIKWMRRYDLDAVPENDRVNGEDTVRVIVS